MCAWVKREKREKEEGERREGEREGGKSGEKERVSERAAGRRRKK